VDPNTQRDADVEERRLARAEEALRCANQAKDALLAMLGHELRNPLAAITSAGELLGLLDPSDPRFAAAREILHTHIQHLVQLVDDMLDVSRLNSGKIRIRRESLDLRDVVEQALCSCEPAIKARRHQLVTEMPAAPLPVAGDAARLEQVFVNLLTNAAKYTDEGGRLTVAGELTDTEAVVRVRDTGIGIRGDLLPQVFELFRQLSPSLHRAEGGLGIGLNIVKNLVELHSGCVTAHSEGPGQGSEFTVRLPRYLSHAAASLPESPLDTRSDMPPGQLRVLVVEDNVDIAHSMAALIGHLGHKVEVAHDGSAALEVAGRFLPQVAFVDIGLPCVSGLELAQSFRHDDRLQSIYLVALTGFGQAEDRRRSLAAGFNEHLVKPLSFDRLQQTLNHAAMRPRGVLGAAPR
jgi:CheY-like chemotaxis protein/two-component sensor histidine kinase